MKNLPRWTRLITEEFYLQGDEEKKRGLKVSPMVIHRTDTRRTFFVRTTKVFHEHSSGALFQISGFMDRENPRLSDLQIGFIKGLVMIRVKSFFHASSRFRAVTLGPTMILGTNPSVTSD